MTEDPVLLDGAKYEAEIGPLPKTPYQKGIEQTIRFLQKNGSST